MSVAPSIGFLEALCPSWIAKAWAFMEQEKLDNFGFLAYKFYCFSHNVNERKIM